MLETGFGNASADPFPSLGFQCSGGASTTLMQFSEMSNCFDLQEFHYDHTFAMRGNCPIGQL
jgi:hypothetical protein